MIQGNRLLVKMFTSQILQSADQAYGVSHPAVEGNVTAVAGRAHARLRVGVLRRSQKKPHSLPSLVLRRESALGDRTAAVNGKLQGDGALGCSGLNPGRGDGPHRPIEILLPRTVNESIG